MWDCDDFICDCSNCCHPEGPFYTDKGTRLHFCEWHYKEFTGVFCPQCDYEDRMAEMTEYQRN